MDDRLITLFGRELRHLRDSAREFARAFPSVAPYFNLGQSPADPYVERLLEGAAFMAARVRLQLDARFPEFTQSLIETAFPDFLGPVPSLAVVRMRPDLAAIQAGGQVVVRGTRIRVVAEDSAPFRAASAVATPCVFSTADDVTLLPVEVAHADWVVRRLHETGADEGFQARSALRIRLRRRTPEPWVKIPLDPLRLYFSASDGLGYAAFEQILTGQRGLIVRESLVSGTGTREVHRSTATAVRIHGFEPSSALLPGDPRTFQGHRILREYFSLPERLLFFDLCGVKPALDRCKGDEIELIVPIRSVSASLEREFRTDLVNLFCVPVVNLFEKSFSQVVEPGRFTDFHLVPDANRSLDYEIHSLKTVEAYAEGSQRPISFRPFLQSQHKDGAAAAFYTARREIRMATPKEEADDQEAAYLGNEMYLSLVDPGQAPFPRDLRQISVTALCTNRHLPLRFIEGRSRWILEGGLKPPVEPIVKPTRPFFRPVDGQHAWKLINLFSVHQVSVMEDDKAGAAALRDLLRLHFSAEETWALRQVEAIRRVGAKPIVRPLPAGRFSGSVPSLAAMVRGLEVTVEFEEALLADRRLFLLGAVLNEFFARLVAMNSFTETVISTWPDNREWMRWPARLGAREIL